MNSWRQLFSIKNTRLKGESILRTLAIMKFMKGFKILATVIVISLFAGIVACAQTLKNSSQIYIQQLDPTIKVNKLSTEELREVLLDKKMKSEAQNDTLGVIISLLELTDLDRWNGDYNDAFEKLWEAMYLSKESNDSVIQMRIDRNLGITYELFNQDSLALRYLLKSTADAKKMIKHALLPQSEVIHCYFNLSSFHRNNGDFDTALQYLDSCDMTREKTVDGYFSVATRGHILLLQGKPEEAAPKLYYGIKELVRRNVRYQVVTFSALGDLKHAENEPDSALYYYQHCLKKMDELNAHVEIRTEVLEKVAGIYYDFGELDSAYLYLQKSKHFSDSLFNAKNESNSKLFKIKNTYLETIEQNRLQFAMQQQEIEEKGRRVAQLLTVLISVVLCCIVVFVIFAYRNKIRKIRMLQELEKEKNNVILESKNRELTNYALKDIENDKAVQELLDIIRVKLPQEYPSLKSKHVINRNKMWDDFNLRFSKLNHEFYQKINEKHPNLSSTEQKHCALIRLNFDCSEMSQILNITMQSVHTSRYRIKKKIGLPSETSLEDYILKL